MANILIAGSSKNLNDRDLRSFLQYLAEDLIDQEHVLLNGCLNEFDSLVSKFAYERLKTLNKDHYQRIKSYICSGNKPIHNYGSIHRSVLPHIGLNHTKLEIPEIVKSADAIILIGGTEGTMLVSNWGRIDNKTPLFPVTAFGGTAELIYYEEFKSFSSKYSKIISKSDYEVLNQLSCDWKKIAMQVISLVEKTLTSKYVFVIMPFENEPKFIETLESFKEVCKKFQYHCSRVDEQNTNSRIIPEIFSRIKKSAFIIADLSEQKPNIYYELGFAQGLDIPVVATAKKGTILPFDVADIPTIYWDTQKELKTDLEKKISQIALKQGR